MFFLFCYPTSEAAVYSLRVWGMQLRQRCLITSQIKVVRLMRRLIMH